MEKSIILKKVKAIEKDTNNPKDLEVLKEIREGLEADIRAAGSFLVPTARGALRFLYKRIYKNTERSFIWSDCFILHLNNETLDSNKIPESMDMLAKSSVKREFYRLINCCSTEGKLFSLRNESEYWAALKIMDEYSVICFGKGYGCFNFRLFTYLNTACKGYELRVGMKSLFIRGENADVVLLGFSRLNTTWDCFIN